jgi:tetratricopeptide (TPR) repeat protein
MNPEPPMPEDRDDITALVSKSRDELSSRASLVARGLRDIVERLNADSLKAAQDNAMELLKQEKLDEAIAICTAALETDPEDESLLQIKGVCLAKQGNVEEGLDCFDRALKSNSGNPHCWLLKSRLLLRLNRTEERLECLRRVIGIESDFKGAWKEIGFCLLELGRYEEAAQAFDSDLKLNPLDAECRSRKDVALRELTRSQPNPSERIQAVDWNQPTLILTMGDWWTEPYYHSPPYADMKCFNFVCGVQNISDRAQHLGKEIAVFHRSKATGEMSKVADASLLESPPEFILPLQLAPKSSCNPLTLELLWPFSAEKPDDDCVREMFDHSYETLAYDEEFGTVIELKAGSAVQTDEVQVEPEYYVAYDDNKGWYVLKDEDGDANSRILIDLAPS